MPTTLPISEISHCSTGVLTVLWAITLIASATCGLLIYSIASFRSAPGHSSTTFVRRTTIETLWAMIPILILISTAMPSVTTLVTTTDRCRSISEAVR